MLVDALLGRCPSCHKAGIFRSFLSLRETCSLCGLNLKNHDHGDGPAFFSILVVGTVITFAAGYVEFAFEPPMWLHAALWGPLSVLLCLCSLRFFKALLLGWQHRLAASQHK